MAVAVSATVADRADLVVAAAVWAVVVAAVSATVADRVALAVAVEA